MDIWVLVHPGFKQVHNLSYPYLFKLLKYLTVIYKCSTNGSAFLLDYHPSKRRALPSDSQHSQKHHRLSLQVAE